MKPLSLKLKRKRMLIITIPSILIYINSPTCQGKSFPFWIVNIIVLIKSLDPAGNRLLSIKSARLCRIPSSFSPHIFSFCFNWLYRRCAAVTEGLKFISLPFMKEGIKGSLFHKCGQDKQYVPFLFLLCISLKIGTFISFFLINN